MEHPQLQPVFSSPIFFLYIKIHNPPKIFRYFPAFLPLPGIRPINTTAQSQNTSPKPLSSPPPQSPSPAPLPHSPLP